MISILIPSGLCLAVYWARFFLRKYKYGKKDSLLVPLAFTCLFMPKITLMRVNPDHNMAGIRVDDVLAAMMLLVSLRDAHTWKNKRVLWGIGFLLAISAANLVSMFTGRAMGYENAVGYSLMFILRRYEYFAFLLIGIYLARNTGNAEKTALEEFAWMSGFHAVIALMQVAGVCNYCVNGIIDYCPDYWLRCALSTFNGHYEYAQFLCFGVAVFLCVFLRTKKICWLGMTAVSLVLLWLTGCRSVMLAGAMILILILFFFVWTIRRRWLRISILAGMLLVAAAGILIAAGVVKVGRFALVNWNEYAEAWEYYSDTADLHEYAKMVKNLTSAFFGLSYQIGDQSAAARFFKWGAAMDGFRQSPLFGYGTGVTEVMDGNYIKLLGENGIIGLVLWLSMFGYYLRTVWIARRETVLGRSVFWMMISVLLGSLLIDMFEASKPAEMMWLAIGLVIGIQSLHAEKPAGNDEFSGEIG